VIVDPAGKDRRFHGCRPRLRKRFHPDVEVSAGCCHFALLANLSACNLDAESDALLVYIQSDVIHTSFEEPPWLWSESTWPLSSALSTPRAPLGLNIQTVIHWRNSAVMRLIFYAGGVWPQSLQGLAYLPILRGEDRPKLKRPPRGYDVSRSARNTGFCSEPLNRERQRHTGVDSVRATSAFLIAPPRRRKSSTQ